MDFISLLLMRIEIACFGDRIEVVGRKEVLQKFSTLPLRTMLILAPGHPNNYFWLLFMCNHRMMLRIVEDCVEFLSHIAIPQLTS